MKSFAMKTTVFLSAAISLASVYSYGTCRISWIVPHRTIVTVYLWLFLLCMVVRVSQNELWFSAGPKNSSFICTAQSWSNFFHSIFHEKVVILLWLQ